MVFLLEYDPAAGKLVHFVSFEDDSAGEAWIERLQREKDNTAAGLDREVVLLTAESEEALKRTLGRYFYTLDELWDQFVEALERPPPPNAALVKLFKDYRSFRLITLVE